MCRNKSQSHLSSNSDFCNFNKTFRNLAAKSTETTHLKKNITQSQELLVLGFSGFFKLQNYKNFNKTRTIKLAKYGIISLKC